MAYSNRFRIVFPIHRYQDALLLLIMRKVVCWQHFLCFVNEFHKRVFQGPRSIRHVNWKTGSDSVTLANSKICWYDLPHVSEFAVYSKICKTVFENFRIRLPNSADRWARKPYWEKKDVDTKISDCVDRAYKVATVFFISFLKVVLKCFFFTKMRTPRSNKRLRCTKTTTTTKETQWNGHFSRKLRRPSSKCNTSPSHLKQLRQSLIIYSNKSLWSYQGPVPQKPINANLRLKINQTVYFSTPKCCSTQIFGKTLHEKTSILKNKNKQKKLSPKSWKRETKVYANPGLS